MFCVLLYSTAQLKAKKQQAIAAGFMAKQAASAPKKEEIKPVEEEKTNDDTQTNDKTDHANVNQVNAAVAA